MKSRLWLLGAGIGGAVILASRTKRGEQAWGEAVATVTGGEMPPESVDSRTSSLTPEAAAGWARIQARLEARGFSPWVYETLRTSGRQAYLYSIGRTAELDRSPVTWTLDSNHESGNALDVIDGRRIPSGPFAGERVGWGSWTETGSSTPDATASAMAAEFFAALGEEAEREGWTWGGSWSTKDLPHIEL
jgi:hypothetical protein